MERGRRTTVGLVAVAAAMVAISLAGRSPGSLFFSGSSGEDQQKLDAIERLRASLHEGMTEEEAGVVLSRAGVAYNMDEQGHRILGIVHRVRWDLVTYESVLISIGLESGRIGKAEFKSVYTGP